MHVKRVMEHYEVYVNGEFEQSCDVGELTQVLNEIENSYQKALKSCCLL